MAKIKNVDKEQVIYILQYCNTHNLTKIEVVEYFRGKTLLGRAVNDETLMAVLLLGR